MAWLLSWLWQGLALTLVVALLLRMAHRLNAATRYAIWWTTLAAVLALPLILAGVARGPAGMAAATVGNPDAPASLILPVVVPSAPDWALSIAIGGWLGFTTIRLFRVARSFAHVRRLKRGCVPMPVELERRLRGRMAARAQARRVALCVSGDVRLPSALGLGRAIIALPTSLAGDLDDGDLDRIVLHELAHLERRDDWARLAQAVLQSVAGIHPAVWWIGRMLDLEREAACDDYVVTRTGEPKRYAVCLTNAAERALDLGRSRMAADQILVPGAARVGRDLTRRVRRVLDWRRQRQPWPVAAAIGAGALAMLAAIGIVAPLTAVVVLVDAMPAGSIRVTLASRAVPGEPAWLAPAVTIDPIRRAAAPLATAVEARLKSRPTLASLESSPIMSGGPVVVQLADERSQTSATLTATPIVDWVGDGLTLSLPVVSDHGGSLRTAVRGPWQKVADAGAAIGAGLTDAGVATAGLFVRAGTSIARSF